MKTSPVMLFAFLLLGFTFNGCISFRSEIDNSVPSAATKTDHAPVTVFFHISHLEQEKGFDVVPKIIPPRRGFRDIFGNAMKEISNIKSFTTFTDNDNDIDDVKRRELCDSLKNVADFTLHLTIKRENSFAKHFLANIFSFGTIYVVPVAYSWDYIVTVDVFNPSHKLVKTYSRTATLSTYTEALFLFVYPFYPEGVKIEEIYLESMKNIFYQIESDGILTK